MFPDEDFRRSNEDFEGTGHIEDLSARSAKKDDGLRTTSATWLFGLRHGTILRPDENGSNDKIASFSAIVCESIHVGTAALGCPSSAARNSQLFFLFTAN
jgi:hypothetical protein